MPATSVIGVSCNHVIKCMESACRRGSFIWDEATIVHMIDFAFAMSSTGLGAWTRGGITRKLPRAKPWYYARRSVPVLLEHYAG
jgi:hypothetical protein